MERRAFLSSAVVAPLISSTALVAPVGAGAEEEEASNDLLTSLFNPDGSLKESVESQAKFRSIEFAWDPTSDKYLINIDGLNDAATSAGGLVKLSYDLPLKWKGPEAGDNTGLYTDLTVEQRNGSTPVKALTRIMIYQSPRSVKQERLEMATTIGVAKALDVIPSLSALESADLVGGRVRTVGSGNSNNKQKMFDFDMAVAPKTCGDSNDNLGLGFCPFDTVYLLTATIVNERLYVFALECNRDQWKRSNSDLRKVRSTFSVTAVA